MTDIVTIDKETRVHSFDLWGVLVQQDVLGPRVLDAYRSLLDGREAVETIEQHCAGYQGVLEGRPEALARKKEHVDTVEDPLWDAYLKGHCTVDFTGAFYADALDVLGDITRSRERFSILTTGNSPWVRKAVSSLNPEAGENLVDVFSGNKTQAEAYESTARALAGRGLRMVSHTEDQLKGLAGILASPLRSRLMLVYVERAGLATEEEVRVQGIRYVTDLRDVHYALASLP